MVMKDYAAAHPEILAKFLRAIDGATTFLSEHKEEAQGLAQGLIDRRLALDSATTVALWDEFTFEMSLDQALIRVLEQEATWAIRNDLVSRPKIPNYLDYIHFEPMEAVKPKAVTIHR